MLALLGVVAVAMASALAFLYRRPVKESTGVAQQAPLRVLGCFDVQEADDDECLEDLWERQRNPRASLGGLKHSLEFERYWREHGIDVEEEEEKLAAYRKLRKHDREGFLRLLSRKPKEYKAHDSYYLSRGVALLDYLFLVLGDYLIRRNLSHYFFCWSTLVVLTHCCWQSTLLTLGSQARGYYVCDQHNRLAERVRIVCFIMLELIFVHVTNGMGAVFSMALKMKTKKRQSLMEFCAGVWVITEIQQEADIR